MPFTASSRAHPLVDLALGVAERRVVGRDGRLAEHAGEVVADRGGQHEVAVGEPLHERAGAEAVGAVVGEVRLAEHVQAGDVAHQVVVDPQAAHRVVDGGVDAHGDVVRVLAGDALVHLEEVAVALLDDVLARARRMASEKSRYTPFFSGPTPRPASTSRLTARDATSRGTRLPNAG